MKDTIVTLRLQPDLRKACDAAAKKAGMSLGHWLRSLAEKETGVKAEVKQGFAAISKTKRKKISRDALKTRWADSSDASIETPPSDAT